MTFAQPEDVPLLDALLQSCGMATLRDPEHIESLVLRPSRERREAATAPMPSVIGCVHLQLVGDRAFLFGLAVAPECRGEGLGWVLTDSVMRRARTLGARWVHLIAGETADFFTDKARVSGDLTRGSRRSRARAFQFPGSVPTGRHLHGVRTHHRGVTLGRLMSAPTILFFASAAVVMIAALVAVSARDMMRSLAGLSVALAAVIVPLAQLRAPLVGGVLLIATAVSVLLLGGLARLRHRDVPEQGERFGPVRDLGGGGAARVLVGVARDGIATGGGRAGRR